VLNNQDIEKAMICLDEALKVYPGRTVDSSQLAVSSK
jgi:aspartate aminotransferase